MREKPELGLLKRGVHVCVCLCLFALSGVCEFTINIDFCVDQLIHRRSVSKK